ncbi:phage portal protein [Agromyces aureus]|uniref:Phage portal protein n=1 Tax=Agromyces aureus TaxID=453304 RepID=A0A191WEX5_9MICO|nr:phage portal protein [Agromyces aureus]ANJ26811.1 hypothetical protein ATC03_08865 [Agromyces aureus]
MKRNDVIELAQEQLIPLWLKERKDQTVLRDWARGVHVSPFKPKESDPELESLLEKTPVPFIMLVVSILAQTMDLKDYHPGDEAMHDDLWKIWQGNRMPMRQKRLYKASLRGQGYTMLLPGEPVPVAKIFSARNMVAVYQDPEADEWPMFAAYGEQADRNHFHFTVADEGELHTMQMGPEGQELEFIETNVHRAGITPVIRYSGGVDDEGAVMGEVEPLIPIQANIDQTNFDRLITQSFEAWKVKYITGMAKPETDAEAERIKMVLERGHMLLIENPEAKVGTLDASTLNGYIEARRDSKQDLASTAQISQKTIVGSQSNNSDGAEAQAAEEASTQRKIQDYLTAFGESHGQFFRLGGHLAGIKGAWEDYAGIADWANSEIRSLSQVADAVGKLRTQVDAPIEGLWEMIPGMSKERLDRWKDLRKEDRDSDPLAQVVRGIQQP